MSTVNCTTGSLLTVANGVVTGLNHLNEGMPLVGAEPFFVSQAPSASQSAALLHICGRVVFFVAQLAGGGGATLIWERSFQAFETRGPGGAERLRAADVDLPRAAGTCDPGALVPHDLWLKATDTNGLFAEARVAGIDLRPTQDAWQDKGEYCRLVCRELECGKLRLSSTALGGGRVFAAGKSTAGHQRKIWDGSLISDHVSRPPKPYRLANPGSFLDIVARPGEPLFFSKRDASTFFDQLCLPAELGLWLAQPALQVREICQQGGSRCTRLEFT